MVASIAGSKLGSSDLLWPTTGAGAASVAIANSAWVRRALRVLAPNVPALESDITDVLYLNWLVPTERLVNMLPAELRIDETEGKSWFTVLTFRHGHYHPIQAPWLQRVGPSPIQSNWRVYLGPKQGAVYFLSVVLNSAWMTLAGRLFSDGLPAHYARATQLSIVGDRLFVRIDPGRGSAPDLNVVARFANEKPAAWTERVEYLVKQNCAICIDRSTGTPIRSDIRLDFDPSTIVPVMIEHLESDVLAPLIDGCEWIAFYIPSLHFVYAGDRHIQAL